MTRRGSASGVLAAMAVLTTGLPLNLVSSTSLQCSNAGALQALHANEVAADQFCSTYAPIPVVALPKSAKRVAATTGTFLTAGLNASTTTITVTATPTLSGPPLILQLAQQLTEDLGS